ncbi:MAG: alanine racemase [Nitrospirae bacterium]|nr:alanine racemase [Nitrospirota bacterium]
MSRRTRLPWQKPTITPHRAGAMNKFGASRYQFFQPDVDGVEIARLVREFGSPLFVISERKLRENVRRLRRAFATRYPRVRYAWSYKTNYLNAVCAVLHQEGAWAEVVSDFEYQKARALGVPGSRILFNGPYKPRAILESAVAEGASIHLDHLDELYLVEDIAERAGKKIGVTMRLNFDTGYADPWSRFGFNIDSGEAMDAARHIAAGRSLRLTGLHSHIGTFILDVRAYISQVRIMADFMKAVESETGCAIETIDIGGGFASRNSLHGVYLPPDQVVPSIEQYAEAIASALMEATRRRSGRRRRPPTLILETGRAIVDDAEVLVASVVGTKRLPDGRRAVVVDAGVNLLFTSFWYHHEFKPVRPLDGIPEETVVYGSLCMNLDVVRHSVMLPPLSVGDSLVIGPAGAYNNTQWLQFIQYRPNVVMIHEDGAVSVVRRAEDLEAITALERLPDHLGNPYPHGLPD